MPADNGLDPLDRWLDQQVRPLPPPDGTFELITRRARRRRIRRAVVSVASAAAVAAAIAVAVPVGLSLHLTTTATNGQLASGGSTAPSGGAAQSMLGTAAESLPPSASGASAAASAPGTTSAVPSTTPGYLPPNFLPSSVTWDSLSTGWVMGPAGTPGQCADSNPYICTSIARTDDGGQTWQGLPAPTVGGPMSATGVTGLRFLNGTYGWAFGPELWATDDGAKHWHKVGAGSSSVTDLETASGRAFALFADCAPPSGTTGDTIANCTSYTLETTTAGSDTWTPVGGVPASLARSGSQPGSAVIELAGPTSKEPATGYLVAPDGTLYAGPLDGTAWHRVAQLPCDPGVAASDGLPSGVMLAPDGVTATGATRLAIVCARSTLSNTVVDLSTDSVYLSTDSGATWKEQVNVGLLGAADVGVPQSLTTLPDGTLILATTGSNSASGGIYLLPLDGVKWQPVTFADPSGHAYSLSGSALADPTGRTYGFRYVGMTGTHQGVALGGDPTLHAIWMTTDGGQTWRLRPIRS